MPVQNIGEDIIGAFLRGRQLRAALEQQRFSQQRETEEGQLREKQFSEQQRQFNETLKRQQEEFKAHNKLSEALYNLNLAKAKADISKGISEGEITDVTPEFISEDARMNALQTGEFGSALKLRSDLLGPEQPVYGIPPGEAGKRVAEFQKPVMELKNEAEINKLIKQFMLNTKIHEQDIEGRKEVAKSTSDARMKLEEYRQRQENYRAQLIRSGTKADARIDRILQNHDRNPVAQRAVVAREAATFVNSLSNTSKSPADDQGLIYAFAKAMDPDSAVKGQEYETVQRYSQSWKDKFGFDALRILNNQEFLTPQSRAFLKETIKKKANSIIEEYGRYRKTIETRISAIDPEAVDLIGEQIVPVGSENKKSEDDSVWMIKLDNGDMVPDTPTNRAKYLKKGGK